jgi:hypothetical protein|tara:strand:+ start:322 stop:525 length:204 start_codon:yes stop_codon:yes gene_type:complete
MSEFQFIVNGELVTYDKYEDIPETFDHVIKFLPDIPSEPHTEEEHEEIQEWNNKFQELMEKERASSN